MKKIVTGFIFVLTVAALQAQIKINDANAQERKVGSFNAIKVSHAIDLVLNQSDVEGIAVSAVKDEYRDRIRTTVENGVLKIWYDDDDKWFRNRGNKKLKAYVSFKTLNRLNASGASDVTVTGKITANKLSLEFSGASDFRGAVQVQSLDMNLSGASDAVISGAAANTKVDASGASHLKAFDLSVEVCNVEASGASDIWITINKELNANASGASSIQYRGSGVVRNLKTGGASSISRKG